MELRELSTKIQIKLHQFSKRFSSDFKRPERKFVEQMIFGILKGGKVQLNSIAQNLQGSVSLKKITERLGRHLGVTDMWQRVSESTLQTQSYYLKQCKYMILDLSDIQKRYAEQMSGLALVWDGSEKKKGQGYWLCNVTGVDESGSTIVPAYSELYSLTEESSSENKKILTAIATVTQVIGKDKVWVDDRGGDRQNIMLPLLKDNQQFIIRQVGNRDLIYTDERRPLKEISQKVKLTETYKVTQTKKNKKIQETYRCGAVQVSLPGSKKTLWLVVLKERNKGFCWLLCHLESATKKEAIKTAFTGYGHRWKIEEVHRQIKGDYDLEGICLQRYEALKNMNALLWAAVSFLYTRLENLSLDIIFHPQLALVNRKKMFDLLRFIHYKLALAVKKLLALSRFYDMRTFVAILDKQLALKFD